METRRSARNPSTISQSLSVVTHWSLPSVSAVAQLNRSDLHLYAWRDHRPATGEEGGHIGREGGSRRLILLVSQVGLGKRILRNLRCRLGLQTLLVFNLNIPTYSYIIGIFYQHSNMKLFITLPDYKQEKTKNKMKLLISVSDLKTKTQIIQFQHNNQHQLQTNKQNISSL